MDPEDSQKNFWNTHFIFIEATYQNDLIWFFINLVFYRMWKNVQICLWQLETVIEDISDELKLDRMNLHSYSGNTLLEFRLGHSAIQPAPKKWAQLSLTTVIALTWKMLFLLTNCYLETSWYIASAQIILPGVTSHSVYGIYPPNVPHPAAGLA